MILNRQVGANHGELIASQDHRVELAHRFHELLDRASSRWGDNLAIVDRSGSCSYRELHDLSSTYANALLELGVRVGDRVIVRAEPHRWVLASLNACSMVGAIGVPVSPDLTSTELRHVVEDAEPALVLAGPPARGQAQALAHVHQYGSGETGLLLYTSGTTGRPKGIVCSHKSMLFAVHAILERLQYRIDDVVLCRLPLSFDYGFYQSLLAAAVGAALVLVGPGDDAALHATIRRRSVSVIPVVPSLANILIRLGRRGAVAEVRLITNTGQAMTNQQIAALRTIFPNAAIQLMYGISECKRVTIANADSDLIHPGSSGTPLTGTSLRIVDEEGLDVKPGEEGQIVVVGPHVMDGYWSSPTESEQAFAIDNVNGERMLFTGDFGRLDPDGELYVLGRRDHLYKERGIRTSVAEVEAAANRIGFVHESLVIPPGVDRGAILVCVANGSATEVLLALRQELEHGKTPTICKVVSQIPLTVTGKPDRRAALKMIGVI